MKTNVCYLWVCVIIVFCVSISFGQPPAPKQDKLPPAKIDLDCQGATAITAVLKVLDSAATVAGSTGKVTFCLKSVSPVGFKIGFKGLKKEHTYKLTLNGKPGRPGNEELKKFGKYGLEGKYDFHSFATDADGNVDGIFEARDLIPGEYDVKFQVKDIQQDFHVVLTADEVKFSVSKKRAVVLDIPEEVKQKQLIKGTVIDRSLSIYVFIHPIETAMWWVQNIPAPATSKGKWHMLGYFGTDQVGLDQYYDVVALAIPDKKAFKAGATYQVDKMQELFKQYGDSFSDVVLVERTK